MVGARALEATHNNLGRQAKRGSQVDQLIHEQEITGIQRGRYNTYTFLFCFSLFYFFCFFYCFSPHTPTQGQQSPLDRKSGSDGGREGGSTSASTWTRWRRLCMTNDSTLSSLTLQSSGGGGAPWPGRLRHRQEVWPRPEQEWQLPQGQGIRGHR